MHLLLFIFLSVFIQSDVVSNPLSTQKKVVELMGTNFEVSTIAENDTIANEAINIAISEISRIEKLISTTDENAATTLINRNAGIRPVKIGQELYDLILRAKKISKLTKGAFDLSAEVMNGVWNFEDSLNIMPSKQKIAITSQLVNWEDIILDPTTKTVFLKKKGMSIGFSKIGKGYAANKAIAKMKKIKGVKGALVYAGGDLISFGESNQQDWTIQIPDPADTTNSLGWLKVDNTAVVTVGDYEQFFQLDGKRYAHLIDPRTGYPTTGIKRVTIVCPDAEVAAALAKSVFVLGRLEGLSLINQLVGIECLIITDDNKVLGSERLKFRHF